jgi:hypothetical protein
MFTARFPLELEMQLAQHATVRGLSKTAVAIEAMQEYFKRKPVAKSSRSQASAAAVSLQKLEDIHAALAAQYPNEPNIDWREARDEGRR